MKEIFKNTDVIIVLVPGTNPWMIPTRVFESPRQENDFLRLLASYYGRPIIDF